MDNVDEEKEEKLSIFKWLLSWCDIKIKSFLKYYWTWHQANLFSTFWKEIIPAKISLFFFKDGLTIIKSGKLSITNITLKIMKFSSSTFQTPQKLNNNWNGEKTFLTQSRS